MTKDIESCIDTVCVHYVIVFLDLCKVCWYYCLSSMFEQALQIYLNKPKANAMSSYYYGCSNNVGKLIDVGRGGD